MKHKIVLVPFPFDDWSSLKIRPAVCLTDEIGPFRHVVIAFISSQIGKATEVSDLHLLPNSPDFAKTGLKMASAIRLHRLVAIPSNLIQRQLGELPAAAKTDVEQNLRVLFGL